jgi:hypothetical protein
LLFDVTGSRLKVTLDGIDAGTAIDTSLASGGVGVRTSQGAAFDDFTMA